MRRRLFLCLVAVLLFISSLQGQSNPCQAPVLKPLPAGADLFNDEQEMELGAISHRGIEQDMKVIEDEKLVGELRKVGDRISQHLPANGIKFHYYIVDVPEANAFSMAGGYIYFTRKIVASFRSEDELAAVMAHEMGHIVTHQIAITISKQMRNVLGIQQVTDIDDVDSRFNELHDSYGKKPGAFKRTNVEKEQLDADQVSMYALAAAGYDAHAFPGWWDRFTENKGKTGGFLSDLTGGTTEEQRRFRDMLKNASALQSSCLGKPPEQDAAAFKQWQNDVLAYNGIGHPERLDSLVAKKGLTPPLRSELTTIKISPDGQYILAEDQSAIQILSRKDKKPLFQIETRGARSAQFTRDSKGVTFYSLDIFTEPRVEVWDIAEQQRRSIHELHVIKGCNQAAVSPDGRYFACVSPGDPAYAIAGLPFDLRLINVETGDTILEKRTFFSADAFSALFHLLSAVEHGSELEVGSMRFSPDSKYFLFGRRDTTLAYNMETGEKLNLPGKIKDIMQVDFSFLDNDRMIGVAGGKGDKGAVVKFPSGEVVYSNLAMGLAHVNGVTKGDFAVIYPLKDFAAGLYDLKQNKYIRGFKKSAALDAYEEQVVSERNDGQLVTENAFDGKELATAEISQTPLGSISAAAVSDDLNFVAISGSVRGALWNMNQSKRLLHLRRFDGVAVDNSGMMVADFPEEGEAKRLFAQIDPVKNFATSFPANEDSLYSQAGPYLIEWKAAQKNEWKKAITFQLESMNNGGVLWKKDFPGGIPPYFFSPETDSLAFVYDVSDAAGKAELNINSTMRQKVDVLKTRAHACGIEVYSLKTGRQIAVIGLDTGKGSYHLRDAFVAGKHLVLADSEGRVQVFDFDGQRIGRFQARTAEASADGHLLATTTGRGKLVIYNLDTMKRADELDFNTYISVVAFSKSGDRLMVVTNDQNVYTFDTRTLGSGDKLTSAK